MFGAMTSLTGGGGIGGDTSSSAQDVSNTYGNTKNYKSGESGGNTTLFLAIGIAAVALAVVLKK